VRSGGDLPRNRYVNKHRRGISRGPFPPVTLGVCCSRGPPVKVHVRSDASTLAVSARVADALKMLILLGEWISLTARLRRRHFGLILQDAWLLSTIALSTLGNRMYMLSNVHASGISRNIPYVRLSPKATYFCLHFFASPAWWCAKSLGVRDNRDNEPRLSTSAILVTSATSA